MASTILQTNTPQKSKLITIFNKQIHEFCDQIVQAFPNLLSDPTIQTIHNTLLTTISLTPNVPIQLFYSKFVNEYDEEILARNEDFFLENFSKIKVSNASHIEPNEINPIDIVKYVYKDASPENKKIIWDYIQRLRLLCIKYYEKC